MDDATDLTPFWPTDGLVLRTPRLVLTPLREADFAGLIDAILAGVHAPDEMPFASPWTQGEPGTIATESLRHWWSMRGAVAPESWSLGFVVRSEGRVIGMQSLSGKKFGVRRTVSSGSWLTLAAHGRGLGTEMRTAVLLFAFDELGALRAESSAFADNPTSLRVSEKVGYQHDGLEVFERREGEHAVSQRLSLAPDQLVRPDWQLRMDGMTDAVRTALGAVPTLIE